MGQVGSLPDVYHFAQQRGCASSFSTSSSSSSSSSSDGTQQQHHCTRSLHTPSTFASRRLLSHVHVRHASQQVSRSRVRRRSFTDPLYASQWYLQSNRDTSLHQQALWDAGLTGRGIVVCVVDDGIEHTHPELHANYMAEASYDYNDIDADPFPLYTADNINKHGTRCAGVVAGGSNNAECGVGVAYEAKVGGIRMLDGPVSDVVEGSSMSFKPQLVDIYSCSWGPADDGKRVEGPGPLTRTALARGAVFGRGGLGNVFVWASGNGGRDDNCAADGYVSNRHTLSVGSVTSDLKSPWFAESCAANFAVTFSSGGGNGIGISTSDLHHKCTTKFSGTSASAPLAAGQLALVLQANPCLGWRDMMHLVAETASFEGFPDGGAAAQQQNAAGLSFSNDFGFGLLRPDKMAERARGWVPVASALVVDTGPLPLPEPSGDGGGAPPGIDTGSNSVLELVAPDLSVCLVDSSSSSSGGGDGGSDGDGDGDKEQRTATSTALCIERVEHVQLRLEADANSRGGIELRLISPAGTTVTVLGRRSRDHNRTGVHDWDMGTVFFWGEDPRGTWRLEIDSIPGTNVKPKSWSLTLYGTASIQAMAGGGGEGGGGEGKAERVTRTVYTDRSGRSCPVCIKGTYADGTGGCRMCHAKCAEGSTAESTGHCAGPGPAACLSLHALGFDGTGSYDSGSRNGGSGFGGGTLPPEAVAGIVGGVVGTVLLFASIIMYRRYRDRSVRAQMIAEVEEALANDRGGSNGGGGNANIGIEEDRDPGGLGVVSHVNGLPGFELSTSSEEESLVVGRNYSRFSTGNGHRHADYSGGIVHGGGIVSGRSSLTSGDLADTPHGSNRSAFLSGASGNEVNKMNKASSGALAAAESMLSESLLSGDEEEGMLLADSAADSQRLLAGSGSAAAMSAV